jgi:NTP pyrophosphatase (non-canonical NTP hydrolase)
MSEVEYIKSRLAKTERLLGLTEEALELALAALKLRRVLDGRNPTPVTEEQATANLLEEYGDVLNMVETLATPTQHELAMQLRQTKKVRWVQRLKAGQLQCPSCGWTWSAEHGVADYCPNCHVELHGGGTVTEPEEERGGAGGD